MALRERVPEAARVRLVMAMALEANSTNRPHSWAFLEQIRDELEAAGVERPLPPAEYDDRELVQYAAGLMRGLAAVEPRVQAVAAKSAALAFLLRDGVVPTVDDYLGLAHLGEPPEMLEGDEAEIVAVLQGIEDGLPHHSAPGGLPKAAPFIRPPGA